jgi:CheY-like chemotaxis protein
MTRLLLVDDEPLLHLALREYLAPHGWRVISAYTLAEARRLAETERYRAALIDLRLPDGDGRELAALLRRHAAAAAIYGWTGERVDEARQTACGFDRILPKPLDPAELQRLLGLGEPATERTCARPPDGGTEPPLLDDDAALAQAAGHATIAARLRREWLAELDREWGERANQCTDAPPDVVTDRALHRLQAAARLCGAPRLAAATAGLRRGGLTWAAWFHTLLQTRRARVDADR